MNQYRQTPYGYQQQPAGAGTTAGQVPTYGTQFGAQYGFPPQAAGPVPNTMTGTPGALATSPAAQIPGMLPLEQSYIENILRLNKGKLTTVYALFDTAGEGGNFTRTFRGLIEAAGRDHLILSDPQSGVRTLLPMVYFAYATFDEELEYEYPFGGAAPGLSGFPPR